MARKLDSQKAALWKERLKRFEMSALTVARFCDQEGCSVASFYQWRRKLRNPSASIKEEAKQSEATATTERFRPLSIALSPPPVGIQFPGGTRLELAGQDHELVRVVVREILQSDSDTARGEL